MKKILVFISIFLNYALIFCQTNPTVSISGTFNPDPDISIGYIATINDGSFTALDSFSRAIDWVTTGPVIGTPPNGNTTTGVRWVNTTNSPQKKIKVTVTYKSIKKVSPPADKVISDERVVTVKFLSPITALIFGNAATPTNPANGGDVTIPCDAGNMTLNGTQTTPLTDPSAAITYTWTFPGGVTLTTSTGTTPFNASGTVDGPITVSAKRNDGSFITSFTVNLKRPRVSAPTLSGLNLVQTGNNATIVICQGSPQIVSVSAANATTFSWTPMGSVSASPSNSSSPSVSASSSAGGSFIVSVDNTCLSPQTATLSVSSSPPTIIGATINGLSYNGSLYVLTGFSSAQMSVSTPILGTVCTWTKNAPFNTNNIYPNFNNCLGYLATNSYLNVTVTTSNTCGSGQSRNFSLYRPAFAMKVSPNPATTTVSVSMDKVVASSLLKMMNMVSDKSATIVRTFDVNNAQKSKYFEQNETVDFDVANLPRGTYYLVVSYSDGKTDKETFILK
jgi:hypothetical protein